jgi:predicted transposase/invertase (TIGR01784 family)
MLKKIITIAILGHEIKGIPNYHVIGSYDLHDYRGMLFDNIATCHIIQVPRLKENQYNLNNKLHRFLIFLDKDSKEKDYTEVIEMGEVIEKGYNILDNTVKNEEEMEIYEMKLKAEMDYNSNIDNAMKKGKEEAIFMLAKKMKKMKKPVEEIVELTNIPKEKIMKL